MIKVKSFLTGFTPSNNFAFSEIVPLGHLTG